MFGVKKYIIKQLTKFEHVNVIPGEIGFRNDMLMKLINEKKEYETLIIEAIGLLNGIKQISFNYDKKIIVVYYDIYTLSEAKVLNWVHQAVNILTDNSNDIMNNINSDCKKVVSIVRPQLLRKAKEFQ